MKKKTILAAIGISLVTSVLTIFGYQYFNSSDFYIYDNSKVPIVTTSSTSPGSMGYIDFSEAAESTVPAVVHISTIVEGRKVVARDPFNPFGGPGRVYKMPNQVGSGSGVIISKDGYIVTNNHVIQGASKVQVTFNNRDVQIAEVIGTDASMDLALLKIKGDNYPYLSFGDSDALKLGQWVLAVGFPLNLETTVTAGIVSAKARSIGINQRNSQNAIESFIQTDAAVNPGNSGGALIDAAGNLVGINTAIASPTGAYAGYSYAIPSNLVLKAVQDLKNYGTVQRGYLGVELVDLDKINPNHIEQLGLTEEEFKHSKGVLLHNIISGGAADKAGLKKGDFVIGVNNAEVFSSPQLMEKIAQLSPGDKVKITYMRKNKKHETTMQLQGEEELIALARKQRNSKQQNMYAEGKESVNFKSLGIDVAELDKKDLAKMNLSSGVIIKNIQNGIIQSYTNIKPGFIIYSINEMDIKNTDDLKKAIEKSPNSLSIAGTYPNTSGMYYYNIQI